MKFDDYEMERTAKAVLVMNPYIREKYESWEDLMSFMTMMAYMYGEKTNSFSTYGFQLTFFKGFDGEINCKPSVCSYTALKFLESIGKA